MKLKKKYYTCEYLEVCECGHGQICHHTDNEEGTCDLDDKSFKCPLGLKRNYRAKL